MLNAKDYPKEKYSAYFECVPDGDEVIVRVYDRNTGKSSESRIKGSPEKWIKAEMAKHVRAK